jgi:hypothetical protein
VRAGRRRRGSPTVSPRRGPRTSIGRVTSAKA